MSTPGTGNSDGERRGASGDGQKHSGNNYDPGANSSDDDASSDYVPGMYSDDSSTREQTPPRAHGATPVPASRGTDDARTQAHTQVVPVTATRNPRETRKDDTSSIREKRLPHAATAGTGVPSTEDRKLLHQREKEHFGGMKLGAGFFGWLSATGLFVLLSALVGAVAALFGIGANLSATDISSGSAEAQTTGITAAVILGVVLLVSYFAGGYVAGRMARFSGLKQGLAVWIWAVIVAVVLAILGLIVGNQTNVTERFQGMGVPFTQDYTGPGLIVLLVIAAVALVGAILGGLAGMRYHRRIDRADFDALEDVG